MAHTIPFDTHAFVKKLIAVGVAEPQAEVQAQAIADLVNEQLATKRDLEELRIATQRDLEEHRIATKRDLEEHRIATHRDLEEHRIATQRDLRELELRLKHDLTLRMGVMLATGITVLAVLDRLL
jgi:hypothetical protein